MHTHMKQNHFSKARLIVAAVTLLQMAFVPSVMSAAAGQAQPMSGPAKIISVGGAITEIIYALDSQDNLAGVDTTSLWPDTAKTLPQVGYMRNLSAEGILSLSPTLLLISAHAGPPKVIEQIREAGIPVKTIAENYSSEGVRTKVLEIAELLGRREQGQQLAAKIQEDFHQLEQFRTQHPAQPRVMFFMAMSQGTPLVSGLDTSADAMIKLAGGNNAITTYQGNKPLGSESIIAAAPDVILVTELTLNAVGGLDKFYELPGIRFTPAGKNRRIIVMDTLLLLGFGPRSGQAALDLARQLHAQSKIADSTR